MHESNGLGIITALILNDINPLGKVRLDLVLELKNNASKLLLAIMESRSSDPENVAEKIIYNMNPKQLIDVACKAYHQEILDEDEDDEDESNNDDGSGEQPRYLGYISISSVVEFSRWWVLKSKIFWPRINIILRKKVLKTPTRNVSQFINNWASF